MLVRKTISIKKKQLKMEGKQLQPPQKEGDIKKEGKL